MSPLASILDQAGSELGGFLPRLGGALVLLVGGLIAAWLVSRLLAKALDRAGLDALVDRVGTGRVLAKAGLGHSLTQLLAVAVRVAITAVAIFAALSLLGLQFLSESLNQAVLFLPKLAVAGALLLAGAVAGALVGERLDRLGREMDLALPIGRIAQITVFAVFAITAAAQVAVSTALLMVLVGILLAGATGTVALAFGLGGQHVAGELSAGRYLRDMYREGEEISFDSLRGTVVRVESATVVLRTVDGDAVRVPNHALLSARVTLHDEPS
ncbi:MAG TPA: mechanosensitive ion channel domain-containing protein [Thermoleophilaceae bacterium]|nr:mechanosensitive ion channel domain-containing protein [Thermoleophilaceae bacterium]